MALSMKNIVMTRSLAACSIALLVGCFSASTNDGNGHCGRLGNWVLPEELLVPVGDPDSALVAMSEDMTRARLNLLALSTEQSCRIKGRYPTSLDELFRLEMPEHVGRQCRPNPDRRVDAWGHAFAYKMDGGVPTILSSGADGELGTEDDIKTASPDEDGSRAINVEADCKPRTMLLQE